jgi:hypothetical protein
MLHFRMLNIFEDDLNICNRGEIGLKASARRRNANIDDDSRARGGRKVDVIGSMKCGGWEILVVEATTPSERSYSLKARTDRIKLMESMKDMLDCVLLYGLNGITACDMESIFTVGVQIVGSDIHVYVINLSHEGVYRFMEVHQFRVPTNEYESLFLRPAIIGFLRIKVSNSSFPLIRIF